LKTSNLFRVVASAFVLSTLSFAAGVAGDLSLANGPTHGTRVVLRIPPELPADTVRAAPLIRTASAEARVLRPVRPRLVAARVAPVELIAKPSFEQSLVRLPKERPVLAPKGERRKGG
jgi:hypothetical protein